MAWNVLNDAVDDTSLRGYLRSTFGSGLNAVTGGAGGAPRTVDPLGAWRHLLATFDAPLNQMEISETKMEWQMVEIATHIGSSARTVQNLHNLLWSIDYKMPLIATRRRRWRPRSSCASRNSTTTCAGNATTSSTASRASAETASAARLPSRTMRTASQRPRASTITP